jgi:integrase
MANVEKRAGGFRIRSRHGGKQLTFTLGVVSEDEANAKAAQVDYLLMRLKQGLVKIPDGIDIVAFVEHDGNPPLPVAQVEANAPKGPPATLAVLRDRYIKTHDAAQEENTLKTAKVHFKHLTTTYPEQFPLSELDHAALQRHVDRRAEDGVKPVTVKKELGTLRSAWNWGKRNGLVTTGWEGRGLVYKKGTEKPRFQTRAEIEKQIAVKKLTAQQKRELWQALYLQQAETDEALAIIQGKATRPWVYPMAYTAAFTGARRSELLRMQVSDLDLDGGTIVVQEKKRVRGQLTTRRVPLAKGLEIVLRNYLARHPGGDLLFCQLDESPTPRSISTKMAHRHLRWSLAKSKWSVIRGWHIFRHGFVSACASKGIDQRLIQTWCGHMSAETSARYSHLYPSTQRTAIDSVFN